MTLNTPKETLLDVVNYAMTITHPKNCMKELIPTPPKGNTYVLCAGKAAASMAQAFEDYYTGDYTGLAVTRYDYGLPLKKIELIEAAHPIPDQAGRNASRKLAQIADQATEDDLIVFLLSGGASALLSDTPDGIAFEEFQDITTQLLHSGATIHEINTVRKHLCTLFGGKLLKRAAPAKVLTIAISDVAGDDPATIGSGPTVADPTTLQDTVRLLETYKIRHSDSIKKHLQTTENETLKANDPINSLCDYRLAMTPKQMLQGTARYIEDKGIQTKIIGDTLEGLTHTLTPLHRQEIENERAHTTPRTPMVILSSGEATVQINNPNGKGGSNAQFALDLAIELEQSKTAKPYAAISFDTDGIDGNGDHGGAYIDDTTIERAKAQSLDARAYSNDNNCYSFFETLGDLLITGPTYTNVNDLRLIYFQ